MNVTLLAEAIAVVPDRLLLINIVRLRVRQFIRGHRPMVIVPPGTDFGDTALHEIIAGKIESEHSAEIDDAPLPREPKLWEPRLAA